MFVFVCWHRVNRYICGLKKRLADITGREMKLGVVGGLAPVTHYAASTLMSLLPTAIPISARSFSSDDIISVTLFL